jgi:DNA replication and repair protein RecF
VRRHAAELAETLVSAAADPYIDAMAQGEAQVRAGDLDAALLPAVTSLTLTDFRGYASGRIAADGRPVVLTGPNGAGKTNLLEAISFLAPGRGLRRAKLTEIDRRATGSGAPLGGPWAVAAKVAGPQGEARIGTGRDAASDTGERRQVRIDGAPARSQTALAEHLSLVWLTPQMDRLFVEGGTARRRFLDRLVYGFDPQHAARVSTYERAMRERARLLRDGPADPAWLGALEDSMAEHGIAVAAARREVAARLDEACTEAGGPFPKARLALDGTVDEWLAAMPALAAEDEFRRRLAAGRRADGEAGICLVGPHRSDLAVRHLGTGMPAAHASTGEQKALLIAILLAHARLQAAQRGAAPILLFDEVAAHLDAVRRDALFGEIVTLGAQAWLTGTDAVLFEGLRGAAQFFGVADAMIAAA